MNHASRVSGITVLLLALLTAFAAAQQPPPSFSTTLDLSTPRVDRLEDGSAVVTLVASGDLIGLVTLQLRPTGDGYFDGDWAFTVAHADNTDPDSGVEPEPHQHEGETTDDDHPHRDYVRLVHRGTLAGTIAGASLSLDADGALAALSAPLTIAQGSQEFAGATGSGQATLGSLALSF